MGFHNFCIVIFSFQTLHLLFLVESKLFTCDVLMMGGPSLAASQIWSMGRQSDEGPPPQRTRRSFVLLELDLKNRKQNYGMQTQCVPATHSFGLLAGCCVWNLFCNWATAGLTGEIVRWQSQGVPEARVRSIK